MKLAPPSTVVRFHTRTSLRLPPRPPLLLLLHLLLLSSAVPPAQANDNLSPVVFSDVSRKAGLDYSFGPKKTYGGPSIADLDNDGYPDLLLTHHDNFYVEIYFNNRNGSFYRVPRTDFKIWVDSHAINAFRYNGRSQHVYFVISRGGAYGRVPAHNIVYRVSPNRAIKQVTGQSGMQAHSGRGRSTLFMPLRGPGNSRPEVIDLLSLNAERKDGRFPHHVTFRHAWQEPRFARAPLRGGYGANGNWYGAPVDFDNNNVIDVVSFETLRFHRLDGPFSLADVTDAVLPDGLRPVGVVAVAELDFDNDGRWDLYVATTRTGDLNWRRAARPYRDYLLRNVGGRFVDVTASALGAVPQDGLTRGVSAADVDNDGYVDLVVSKYWGRSVVLRNVAGRRFVPQKWVLPPRLRGAPGDGLACVDYDLDGRVDAVVSEGDGVDGSRGGFYRLLHNVSPRAGRHYLLVRVGASPGRTASPMHALVRVRVRGMWMQRRVGPSGVAVAVSMIDTLHFGLGWDAHAEEVVVRWLDGSTRWLSNVPGDQVLTVGWVPPVRPL